MLGIIIPMIEESSVFKKRTLRNKIISIDDINYELGKIGQQDIVFVNSGIGKINSAAMTARLIRDFHPDSILAAGSAGSINPKLATEDVVIGKNVIDADFGTLSTHGVEFPFRQYLHAPQTKGSLPLEFDLDRKFLNIIQSLKLTTLPKIILGKIATSDALPNPASQIELLQQGKFDVIDMEGAAVMQSCWLFATPCVIIRGVSNFAGQSFTQQDVELAAENAVDVLIHIVENYQE